MHIPCKVVCDWYAYYDLFDWVDEQVDVERPTAHGACQSSREDQADAVEQRVTVPVMAADHTAFIKVILVLKIQNNTLLEITTPKQVN